MQVSNSITRSEQLRQLEALLEGRPNPLTKTIDYEEMSRTLGAVQTLVFK